MQARADWNLHDATDAEANARAMAAYGRWAPVYDLVFELPFGPGRRAAARAASAAVPNGGRLLVIGVGTGLELPLIGAHARVEGIDISEPMLKIARARVARAGLSHVRDLRTMDAQALALPDETFDAALAPYVLSVVPDPGRALDEAFRTLKPGGEIVTVNHFAAERGPRAAVEAGLEGAASFLGWHPNFPFAPVARWLAANPRARLVERREVAPFRLFTMLRIAKTA